jgi:ornithine cyclodeaminase
VATTTFVSVAEMARLVRDLGLKTCIEGVVEKLEEDYGRWETFQKSARTANHCELGVVELMPSSTDEEFAFKYVNGHPKNYLHGMSTVMAFGALSDLKTGWPNLLSEMTLLTAIRTAAMSVFAAKHLAKADSTRMAMIGCGAQSEFQIIAFNEILGIREFFVFDTDPHAAAKLKRNLSELNVTICNSIIEAVNGVDIVTTCTADKTKATILTGSMIEPGMHINAIGGDCPGKTELAADVLTKGNVYVEYEPQTRVEGDIQQMSADFPVTELWRVLQQPSAGRMSDSEVTIYDSVGFALEDFSALRWVYSMCQKHAYGEPIDLVPIMPDVKDLYGHSGLVRSLV